MSRGRSVRHKRPADGLPPKAPKNDSAWFERKVAELKAELDQLPSARRSLMVEELDREERHTN